VRALVTDETGRPAKEPMPVKLTASAGSLAPEVVTKAGVVEMPFTPPAVPGDVELAAECDLGRCPLTVPVVPGKGRVLSRTRILGFEPTDTLDSEKSLKTFCERFELATDTAQVYEGYGGLRLNFAFEQGKWGEASVCVGKEIPGRPTCVAVFAHSEGPACEVNFLLKDLQGQVMTRHGCTLWSKGWSYGENLIDSPPIPWLQPKKEPLSYPLTLEHVVLRAMPLYGARFRGEGTVYLDGLLVIFLAAESELPAIPLEVSAKQDGERVLATLRNTSAQPCTARVSYRLTKPDFEDLARGVATKAPVSLQPGEVVELPLSFPEVKEPGEYPLEIIGVAAETGDLVEVQTKWRRE
jgi:hypothetical protein